MRHTKEINTLKHSDMVDWKAAPEETLETVDRLLANFDLKVVIEETDDDQVSFYITERK